jgi:hypothetical protein
MSHNILTRSTEIIEKTQRILSIEKYLALTLNMSLNEKKTHIRNLLDDMVSTK